MAPDTLKGGDPWTPLIEKWTRTAEVLREAEKRTEKIPPLKEAAERRLGSLYEAGRARAGDDQVQQRLEASDAESKYHRLAHWEYVSEIEKEQRRAQAQAGECLEQTIHTLECHLARKPSLKDQISTFERYRQGVVSAKDVHSIIEKIQSIHANEPRVPKRRERSAPLPQELTDRFLTALDKKGFLRDGKYAGPRMLRKGLSKSTVEKIILKPGEGRDSSTVYAVREYCEAVEQTLAPFAKLKPTP